MPQIITDSGGNEMEVFTKDELEAQREEAIEAYKQENPDRSEELEALQAEKEEATAKIEAIQKQLEGELDKDKNFAELRKQKEELEQELKGFNTKIEEQVEGVKKEIFEGVNQDHYNETLKTLVGDDEGLQKKVELNYSRLADEATTKEAITKKLTDAYRLSADEPKADVLNTAVVSSSGAAMTRPSSTKGFSQEEKAAASKFGLSAEDLDKYGK